MEDKFYNEIINTLNKYVSKIQEDEFSQYLKKQETSDFNEEWLKDDLSECADHNNTLYSLKRLVEEIISLKVKNSLISSRENKARKAFEATNKKEVS